jgi:L-threonylcarbamoyladenylate synthase
MKLIECQNRHKACRDCDLSDHEIEEILATLRSGRLVVYPTDTLYALGADPFNEKAISRLYEVKNRPAEMPISIAVDSLQAVEKLVEVDARARKIIRGYLPGPLTILIKERNNNKLSRLIPKDGKIGIRIPDHSLALHLIGLHGPITATSANKHNGRSPKELKVAMDELGDAVDIYVDCGPCKIGRPSAVIDLTTDDIKEVRGSPTPKEPY